MRKLILGLVLGFLLSSSLAYAYRIAKPIPITEITPSTLYELNSTIEELWNITNGRLSLDIVTTNPDGNTKGDVGNVLLYNNSGTYFLEINVTGSTIWRGVALTDAP